MSGSTPSSRSRRSSRSSKPRRSRPSAAAKRAPSTAARDQRRPRRRASGRGAAETRRAKTGGLQRPLWIWIGAIALAGDAVQRFIDDAQARGEEILRGGEGTRAPRARKAPARRGGRGTTKRAPTGKWTVAEVAPFPPEAAQRPARRGDNIRRALGVPTHADLLREALDVPLEAHETFLEQRNPPPAARR